MDREEIPGKDASARQIAKLHFDIESGMKQIFRLNAAPDAEMQPSEPIKLLEVNEGTAPSGVMPLHFGALPARGIYHSSVIVEVTPGEYEKIRNRELSLPKGWTIGDEIPKPLGIDED